MISDHHQTSPTTYATTPAGLNLPSGAFLRLCLSAGCSKITGKVMIETNASPSCL